MPSVAVSEGGPRVPLFPQVCQYRIGRPWVGLSKAPQTQKEEGKARAGSKEWDLG